MHATTMYYRTVHNAVSDQPKNPVASLSYSSRQEHSWRRVYAQQRFSPFLLIDDQDQQLSHTDS